MKTHASLWTGLLLIGLQAGSAHAAELNVTMQLAEKTGPGATLGTITVSESPYGLVFTPALSGLPPGLHGFHVHEKGSCAAAEKDGAMVPGLAAGGHYDPAGTKKHDTHGATAIWATCRRCMWMPRARPVSRCWHPG